MAKRKLSLLVQAMNIFAQLDERDKQTLADYIRSQTVTTRPKSTAPAAPSAGKKSSRKTSEPLLAPNTEVETVNASAVGGNGD